MSVISLYAIFANAEEAERIGSAVVEDGLAACVNILGTVHSIYRWEGAIAQADEVAAIFKTTETAADALITRLAQMHSYDVPCIATWPVGKSLDRYADWVEASVR